jgi:hypothetical protein
MSASETVNLAGAPPRPGFASGLLARLRGLLPRSLNNAPLLARSAESAGVLVVAHHGAVEIRRTATGWALETCVKGEPEQARETALRRLAGYAAGKNIGHNQLGTIRPLVQTAEAAGRWRVRIGVAGTDIDVALTSARSGRVRVRITEAATIAVIRTSGRPTPLAIQQAETAIRDAIAATRWEAAGSTMLRLDALPSLLPMLGGFEVAVPVIERPVGSVEPSWSRGTSAKEAATASSLPVH